MERFSFRNFFSYLLLLVIIYFFLFAWGQRWLARLQTVKISGQISDISENFPIELVVIRSSGPPTFTNYLGQFALSLPRGPAPHLGVESPKNFEPLKEELTCQKVSDRILDVAYSCSAFLYPQPFEVAARVLNGEMTAQFKNGQEANKLKIWSQSASISQAVFADRTDFIDLLVLKEQIETKLKKQLIGYKVSDRFETLPDFKDFPTGQKLKDVAAVGVTRFFADGANSNTHEYFLREKGIWRYLLPYRRQELSTFVAANRFLLKEKR